MDDMTTTRRRVLLGTALAAACGVARAQKANTPATRDAKAAGGQTAPATAPAIAPATGAKQAESLVIGALFPFSGALALQGDESFRGLDLATDERNAAGGLLGHPIRLARGDAMNAGQAVSETHRLMGAEHVVAIFGGGPSSVSLAASQQAELAGTPFFELAAPADAITARGFKYLFRSCPTATQRTALAVDAVPDMLARLWRVRAATLKIAILHVDTLNATATAALQEKHAQERKLTLIDNLSYATGTTDLSPAIQRLRGDGADVVLHTGAANDIPLLYRGMAKAGWTPRMIIGSAADYALGDTMQAVGAAFQGTMNADVTQYKVNPAIAPGVAATAAAYLTKYGAPPRSGQSLASYVGAKLFYDAIMRAGSTDKDKIRAAVLATDVAPGGTAAGWGGMFDATGQNLRAQPFLMQWRDAVQVTVFPEIAAVAPPSGTLGA
ncbi:MAG TPA: ABC transporter substrate-binding protein [Acetobacteraceae bacterium]